MMPPSAWMRGHVAHARVGGGTREGKPAPADRGPDHHSGTGPLLQVSITHIHTKCTEHCVGGIPEEMRIGDSPRWNRGSMATLSAPPAHAWLAPQPRSGPSRRDDTLRSSRTVSRPDPATPAERPSNSQTAAAAAVALRPIPALAIQAGGAVAASTAAHRAGPTAPADRARKAAAGAGQAPHSTLPLPEISSVQVMRHVGTRGGCRRGGRVGVRQDGPACPGR